MRTPLSIALLAALAFTACDSKQDRTPRPFLVDSQGSHYILDHPKKGPIGASQLESIPMHQRGIVRVRNDSWPPTRPSEKGAWVVDLTDAVPGSPVVAQWRSNREILGAQLAQNRAYHFGLDVHFVASELAVVHPMSARNKRAIKLRQLLPEEDKGLMPPPSSQQVNTP